MAGRIVDDSTMNWLLTLVEGKYRKEYLKKHGVDSLMNMFNSSNWNDEKSEEIYKICLEKDITWKEYYRIDPEKEKHWLY